MSKYCKGCGIEVEEDAGHAVAHWVFCTPCFEHLMADGSGEPSQERATEPEPEHCALCDSPIAAGDGRLMLGLLFCAVCHGGLTRKSDMPSSTEPQDLPPAWKVAQERTNTGETLCCDGCGRRILAAGAHEKEEKRLCPECFYGVSSPVDPICKER